MPFSRPSLSTLRGQAKAHFQVEISGFDPTLPRTVLGVTADLQAAMAHGAHAHLAWVARQAIPATAEADMMEVWASVWGLARRAATRAAGPVVVTGTDGTDVPAETQFTRGGLVYRVTTGATIAAGSAIVTVEAVLPGAAANAPETAPVRFLATVPGADGEAQAGTGGLVGGADAEPDADLRARLLERIRKPPAGGAAHDYRAWAFAVAGVTRVWVEPEEQGPGTVVVRFMMDDVRAAQQGIPQGTDSPAPTGDQALVFDAIDPVRPVTADVFVVAPVAVPLAVTVTGLDPDTPAIRAAIEASLADMLHRRAEPGVVLSRSWVAEAVSAGAGENRHVLTVPAADIVHGAGEIPVMGTVTYA